MTPEDRFWEKIEKVTSGCWEWTGALSAHGYGRMRFDGADGYSHRFAVLYIARRPIPSGLVVDHLCRNRKCANPEHLDVVTQGVNNERGVMVARSREAKAAIRSCPHGHEYTPENTRLWGGKRNCRACGREWARRKRLRGPNLAQPSRVLAPDAGDDHTAFLSVYSAP